jgi:hypothetical protein
MANFCYLNVSPDKSKHRNDCVTRAISLASGLPYSKVRKKLYHTAQLLDCEKLCVSCYTHLIEKVLCAVPKNCDYMTVNDFAEIHPQGTYLLRMNGHITTLIDYTVFDLFDCREYFITNAWEIR